MPAVDIWLVIKVFIGLIVIMLVYSLDNLIVLAGSAFLTQHADFKFFNEHIEQGKLFLGRVNGIVSTSMLLRLSALLLVLDLFYLVVSNRNVFIYLRIKR